VIDDNSKAHNPGLYLGWKGCDTEMVCSLILGRTGNRDYWVGLVTLDGWELITNNWSIRIGTGLGATWQLTTLGLEFYVQHRRSSRQCLMDKILRISSSSCGHHRIVRSGFCSDDTVICRWQIWLCNHMKNMQCWYLWNNHKFIKLKFYILKS